MAKAGSMKDTSARAKAGQGTGDLTNEDIVLDGNGEAVEAKPKSNRQERRARQSDDRRDTRRRTVKEPNGVDRTPADPYARDRALLRGAPEEEVDEGDDPIDDAEGLERKPRKRRDDRNDETPVFKYRGQTFKTEEELEDYIDELHAKAAKRRARTEDDEPPPRKKEKQEPKKFEVKEDDLITKPTEVFQNFTNFLREELKEVLATEVIGPQRQDAAIKEFWRDFYGENPELNNKKLKRMIESTFWDNFDAFADLPTDRSRAKLARMVKKDLSELGVKLKPQKGGDDHPEEEELLEHRTAVESGGRRRTQGSPARERAEERPTTLGEMIRARKNARLDARAGV